MRVFVAGASGAIGSRLVPQLIDAGHEVIGTDQSPANAELLRALGAEPIVLDLLDARAVRKAVLEAEPEAIVHEATALADVDVRAATSTAPSRRPTGCGRRAPTRCWRPRARPACAGSSPRASRACATRARAGRSRPRTTRSTRPRRRARRDRAAMRHLDETVTDAGGVALRYGGFYGAANDGLIEPVRKRQFPIVGDGGGVCSFIHLDDAAAATVLALEHDGPAVYNVVDDEPAPVREWLPVLAEALGRQAAAPLPALARAAGSRARQRCVMGTESRGASNAKAKRELGWAPRYPSWRKGFPVAYAAIAVADGGRPRSAATTGHSVGPGRLPSSR